MTFATLRALHAVIGAALDDMERVYRERAPGLDFPSLDDPYYTTGPHSHEEELMENLRGEPVVAAACKSIVAACGQLNVTFSNGAPPYNLTLLAQSAPSGLVETLALEPSDIGFTFVNSLSPDIPQFLCEYFELLWKGTLLLNLGLLFSKFSLRMGTCLRLEI